ncbi:MAG: type IV secretory system conjugative DNA transfer family protein, partial [Chloroflexi bacterium]|nr:type IV secretory system conjugative DNA transfer family protein [Chloroflexota bacterium]
MSLPWPFLSSPKLILGTPGPPLINLPFVLGPKDVATHKHVIGVTGQGKSKLLASMFLQLVNQGVGCALIDPHSDLASDALAALLSAGFFKDERAFRRLLYIDFGRHDYYLPFNALCQPYDDHSIARNVVETCKRAWPALADGSAPNFENILLASVLVLVQNRLPITTLPKLLTEKGYRDSLLKNVSDIQIIEFFHNRFDHWGKEAPLMIESTLRRVFLLTFSPTLRYSLGQNTNALQFRRIMDSGQAVIFDLGGLDEETQKFLGCLISVGFEVAALSRSNVPQEERRQYQLIMDEFSMFSAQSEEALARVLSLARKYGLYLTLAHQTWSQLSTRLRGALQNSIEVAFRLGRSDAEWAAPRFGQFDPYLIKHEIVDPFRVDRTHPVYFALQEQLESWVLALETLKPREAFVSV